MKLNYFYDLRNLLKGILVILNFVLPLSYVLDCCAHLNTIRL